MIPMVDLKGQYHALKHEIDQGIREVLESTRFILGPNVKAFEEEIARYLGVPQAVACASGTDALHLALIAAGIGEDDEVITTPFTFIATAEAIRYVGAIPVFVDIDPQTFNIDPDHIEAAITPRTRAIIPVHLFGQPAEMVAIRALAGQHSLKIIEDCAQSFGATLDGQQTGVLGDLGAFSFFPSKNLGGYGDGGLITTHSEMVAEHLHVLRNHGSWQRYHHSELGFNSRLDELQAAVLRVKLRHIDEYSAQRRRVAQRYNEGLKDLDLVTPYEDGRGLHVYHQYTLLSERRDAIMSALQARQIGCAIYYPLPLHQQEVFRAHCAGTTLPIAEAVAHRCLSLPIFPELSDAQIDEVVATIRDAL